MIWAKAGRDARRRALGGLTAALLTATPALAQTLGHGAGGTIAWWRVFGATGLCLLLGVAGVLALKARRDGLALSWAMFDPRALGARLKAPVDDTRRLRVVETVRLPHQVEVSLLTCDDESVLIATSPHGAFVVAPGAGVERKARP